ncbi:MAG: 8-oxo-dGTP diphosphatase [Ruminococcaceae bacterium]|nr:8-oxo-dGTP diphosphatase [Oscillospiraceae bacterium]
MKITTLCYISNGERTLMLHRNKKENDENAGKWVGIGGKLEEGESPEDCLVREVYEETGIKLKGYAFRGIVTFVSDKWGTEYMCLYTATAEDEALCDCSEGDLEWVENEKLDTLPMWEGDRVFFDLIKKNAPFFSLKLTYKGDSLVSAVLDGKAI